jgi:hypothetical protein
VKRMTDQPETPGPNPPPEKTPKRSRGDAMKKLRKAAQRHVRDNSAKIAQALLDRTLEGNMPSAKMLVSLIGKKTKVKEPESKRGETVAINLAAEPQCPPEDDEANWYPPLDPPYKTNPE